MKSLMENLQLVSGKSPGLTILIALKPLPICFCVSVCQTHLDYLCDRVLTPNALFSLNVLWKRTNGTRQGKSVLISTAIQWL